MDPLSAYSHASVNLQLRRAATVPFVEERVPLQMIDTAPDRLPLSSPDPAHTRSKRATMGLSTYSLYRTPLARTRAATLSIQPAHLRDRDGSGTYPRAMVVGHRGYRGVGAAPGNTIESFETAVRAGAEMLEFDVRRTRDGQLVIHHDARIGGSLIRNIDRAQLPTVAGAPIPTLEETLQTAQRLGVKVDVELKEAGYERQVVDTVMKYFKPNDVIMKSFKDSSVREIEKYHPEITTGILRYVAPVYRNLRNALAPNAPVDEARRAGADFIAVHQGMATESLLNAAAGAKLPVAVWTVKSPTLMKKYFADPRISWVITDVADVARWTRNEIAGNRR